MMLNTLLQLLQFIAGIKDILTALLYTRQFFIYLEYTQVKEKGQKYPGNWKKKDQKHLEGNIHIYVCVCVCVCVTIVNEVFFVF